MQKIVFVILLFSGMNNYLFAEKNFSIHCFNRPYAEPYNLSTYEYDSTWNSFLQGADLGQAVLVIDHGDINEYRWKEQIIKISDKALGKIYECKGSLYQMIFIVTLNGKRMYAGRILSKLSAMAVKFPVIYYDEIYEGHTLQIYPVHNPVPLDDIPQETKAVTLLPGIREYFESVRKIK